MHLIYNLHSLSHIPKPSRDFDYQCFTALTNFREPIYICILLSLYCILSSGYVIPFEIGIFTSNRCIARRAVDTAIKLTLDIWYIQELIVTLQPLHLARLINGRSCSSTAAERFSAYYLDLEFR